MSANGVGSGGSAGVSYNFLVADAPVYIHGATKLIYLDILPDGSNAATARASFCTGGRQKDIKLRSLTTTNATFNPVVPVAVGGYVTIDLVGTTSQCQVVVDRYAYIQHGYGKAGKDLICQVNVTGH